MKKVVVIGGGISGLGASYLAKKKGFDIFLSDIGEMREEDRLFLEKNDISYEDKKHSEDRILQADLIIKSPGVPNSSDIICKVERRGIPVISEIEFASKFTNGFIIGVTGSNGKSTTVSLIFHILNNCGLEVSLCGNIGKSFAMEVATGDKEYYVLEISSFQLDNVQKFRPNISVITNISEDHMDRYEKSLEKYAKSKLNITKNQQKEDIFIFNGDDVYLSNLVDNSEINSEKIAFSIDDKIPFDREKLKIKGLHNVYNSLTAFIVATKLGLKQEDIKKYLYSFRGIEHRLEFVKEIQGVEFINDSKGTNVDATFFALQAMQKDVVWIAGGIDKGNDYSRLEQFVPKIKALICLGKDNEKLIDFFSDKIDIIEEASSMSQAVKKSKEIAKPNQVVLLSPCCASFDLFKNFEDRGEQFKNCVKA